MRDLGTKTYRQRLWWLIKSIAEGRYYGIPWCCTLRWSITTVWRLDSMQSRERGGRFHDPLTRDPRRAYVPCEWFHQAH